MDVVKTDSESWSVFFSEFSLTHPFVSQTHTHTNTRAKKHTQTHLLGWTQGRIQGCAVEVGRFITCLFMYIRVGNYNFKTIFGAQLGNFERGAQVYLK